jgi:hypothetical protein
MKVNLKKELKKVKEYNTLMVKYCTKEISKITINTVMVHFIKKIIYTKVNLIKIENMEFLM